MKSGKTDTGEIPYSKLVVRASKEEKRLLQTLATLVQYQSVNFRDLDATRECASAVAQELRERGYEVMRYSSRGAPLIFAEKDVDAPRTLMFYHHYDVQPEGELGIWKSSPWKLEKRANRLYGRGTSDDKGPFVASLFGIEILESLMDGLPVNVKFVVDGEEESGRSIALPKFEAEHPQLMKADGCIWEVASAIPGRHAVVICGVKGDAYFELRAGGTPRFAQTDIHSGSAGAIPNPAWRLVWALSTLKDTEENILVEGFEEEVCPPTKQDLDVLNSYRGDIERSMKREYGITRLLQNRRGFDLRKELWMRPELTISGLTSGCQGEDDMTIVPAKASAKVDVRLVPSLTVGKTERLLRRHLSRNGFNDIEVVSKGGSDPARTPVDHVFIRTVRSASIEVVAPSRADVIPMSEASGPVSLFTPHTPICMTYSSVESEGTNTHAPNENALLASFKCGMAFTALIAQRLAKQVQK